MATFEDIEKIEIDDEQLGKLKELYSSGNFLAFREIVESYILKKTNALLIGTPIERVNQDDYFKELRGFARHWSRLLKIVERHEKRNEA